MLRSSRFRRTVGDVRCSTMEPERAAAVIRREIARRGGFVLESVGGIHETRRLGTSSVVARFPESEEGISAAHEDLSHRAHRERRRLLLPRLLGVLAITGGILWITAATGFAIAPASQWGIVSRTGNTVLITSSLLLVGSFIRSRLRQDEHG